MFGFVDCYLYDGGDVARFIQFEGKCLRGLCKVDPPTEKSTTAIRKLIGSRALRWRRSFG